MLFALDYDGTYDRDPDLWNIFISLVKKAGHEIVCVTMRYEGVSEEWGNEGEAVVKALKDRVDKIFFTGRKAKKLYMIDNGLNVDIWIDDQPHFIIQDAVS